MKKKLFFISLLFLTISFSFILFLSENWRGKQGKATSRDKNQSLPGIDEKNGEGTRSEKIQKSTKENSRIKIFKTPIDPKQNGKEQWTFRILNLRPKETITLGFYNTKDGSALFSKRITSRGLRIDKGLTYRVNIMTPGYSFLIRGSALKTLKISESLSAARLLRHPTISGTILTEEHLPAAKVIVYPVDSKGRRVGWYGTSNKEGHFTLKLENYINKAKTVTLKGAPNDSFTPIFGKKKASWGDSNVILYVRPLSTLRISFKNPVPIESHKDLGVSLSNNDCFGLREHFWLGQNSLLIKGLPEGDYSLSILDKKRIRYFGPESITLQKGKNYYRLNLKEPKWDKLPDHLFPKNLKVNAFLRIQFLQNKHFPFLRSTPLFSQNLFSGCNGVLWETRLIPGKPVNIPMLFPKLNKWVILSSKGTLVFSIPFLSHISFPRSSPAIPKNKIIINLYDAGQIFQKAPLISRTGILRFSLVGKEPFLHWPAFGKHQKINKKRSILRGIHSGLYKLTFSLPWVSHPLFTRNLRITSDQEITLNISIQKDLKLGSIHFEPPKPFHPNDFVISKVGEKRSLLSFVTGKALYTPLLLKGEYSIRLKESGPKTLQYQRLIQLLPGQRWKGK